MADVARVIVVNEQGQTEGQPAADFGVLLLTQAPVVIREDGPDQPVAAHLSDFATELDTARSIPGVWTYPGNGGSLAPNQTVFTVPGGYTPGFVDVSIGSFALPRTAFTATDGSTVVIGGFTFGADDVVTISVLKAGAIANTASKAEVDGKLDTTGEGGGVVVTASATDAQPYALAERAGDEVSVMSFIPLSLRAAIRAGTSNADVTAYVRKAIATGKRVYFPKGRYRVTDKLTYAPGQVLYGDGVTSAVFVVDAGFNMAASAVFEGLGSDSSGWDGIGIEFDQTGVTSRATLRKYPWALDISTATRFKIGRIRISAAWNGVRGEGNCGGLDIGLAEIGAFNRGMITDGLLDFLHSGVVHLWPFNFANNATLMSIYLDGSTDGWEIGQVDGLDAQSINSFGPRILGNANGNDGAARQIGLIQLDGDNSRFENLSGDFQIGLLSTTKSGARTVPAVTSSAGFVSVTSLRTWGNNNGPFLTVTGGVFSVEGGPVELFGDHTAIEVSGGRLNLQKTKLFPLVGSEGPARTTPFVRQTGTGVLVAKDNVVSYSANGGGGTLFAIEVDNADNVVSDNVMAGWGISLPDGQIAGSYDGNIRPTSAYVKGIAVGREYARRLTGTLNASGEATASHGIVTLQGVAPAERIFAISASSISSGGSHFPYPLTLGSAWDGTSVLLRGGGSSLSGAAYEITVRYR